MLFGQNIMRDKAKDHKEKLTERSKELFDIKSMPNDEPQFLSDPNKIFEEDSEDKHECE